MPVAPRSAVGQLPHSDTHLAERTSARNVFASKILSVRALPSYSTSRTRVIGSSSFEIVYLRWVGRP